MMIYNYDYDDVQLYGCTAGCMFHLVLFVRVVRRVVPYKNTVSCTVPRRIRSHLLWPHNIRAYVFVHTSMLYGVQYPDFPPPPLLLPPPPDRDLSCSLSCSLFASNASSSSSTSEKYCLKRASVSSFPSKNFLR